MKTCLKSNEPTSLTDYRAKCPESTWDEFRDDPFHGGMAAYPEAKTALVKDQRGLCAYCEIRIAHELSDEKIAAKKAEQRIEHFHPKEDVQRPPNWALHWPNMWVVCHGGSEWPPTGEPLDPRKHLSPLKDNLSCDAFKGREIESGNLPNPPEGWILAPDHIPPFPLLFQFASDGTPEPHSKNCGSVTIPGNMYADTTILVEKTIKHLNLGCPRLKRMRSIARAQLEKQIKQQREANRARQAKEVLLDYARRIFATRPDHPWPEFFALVRWRLGEPVESRLREIRYAG